MLCCFASWRRSSNEGIVWLLALALSSSESFDTELKGSVWKVRQRHVCCCAITLQDYVYKIAFLTFKNQSPAFRLCSSSQVKSLLLLVMLSGNLSLMLVVLSRNPEWWSCIRKGILSLLDHKTNNISWLDRGLLEVYDFASSVQHHFLYVPWSKTKKRS